MAFIEITLDNYNTILSDHEMVFIHFWTDESNVCDELHPIFEKISGKHADIKFSRVNLKDNIELAQKFGIKKHSTLTLAKSGVVIYQEEDVVLAENDFNYVINKARELDMAAVRQEMAEDSQ